MAVLFAIMNILNFGTDQAGHKVASITEGQEGVQSAFSYSFNYEQSILAKGGSVTEGEAQTAATTMSWLYGELGMNQDGTYNENHADNGLSKDDILKMAGNWNDIASGYCTEVAADGYGIMNSSGSNFETATPANKGANGPNDPGFWTPYDLTRQWVPTNGNDFNPVQPIQIAQQKWDADSKDTTNPIVSPNLQSVTFAYGQLTSQMSGLTSQSKSTADIFSDILNRMADADDKMGTQENELTKAMVAGSAPK
jgi:hypothetical protein